MQASQFGGILALALIVGAPVCAQDVTVSAGATVTSDYISDGISQSGGPALQGYVEAQGSSGFYAGVWGSTIDSGGDSVEVDLSLGYRGGNAGGFTYDMGYTRYVYIDSGDCCGEIGLSLGIPVTPAIGLTADLAVDPSAHSTTVSLTGDYALSSAFGLSATLGRSDSDDNVFGKLGATYDFSDAVSVEAAVHDTSNTDTVASLSVSFDLSGVSR
jgi:uncharacterized protein (TIGR02001 family)